MLLPGLCLHRRDVNFKLRLHLNPNKMQNLWRENRSISRHDMDSLEDEVRSGVDGPADVVVGSEGEDPGPAAGPHTPVV